MEAQTTTQMIHTRVDPNVKREAELVLSALGMNTSEAIRMFLAQIALQQGIPFEVRIPNKETQKAIKDSRLNKNLSPFSIDDLDKL